MKKNKTVCKNKPHQWKRVTEKIDLWPGERELYWECERCGRRQKKGIVMV